MKLTEPITIRNMRLNRRVIMPAMANFAHFLGSEGPTEAIIDFYAKRAEGGVGAVIVGALPPSAFIADEDLNQTIPPLLRLEALGNLATKLHAYGTKVGVQLFHTNMFPSGAIHSTVPEEYVAPSPRIEDHIPYQPKGQKMRQLTIEEIHAIIGRFALAASRIKNSGVDFVEFHQSHGHLPYQFFTPLENRRDDRYGGGSQDRMTFGLECVTAMRKAVGNHYPIFVRLGVTDEAPGGITPTDAADYAVELDKDSVDCINVSVGTGSTTDYASYASPVKKSPAGTYAHLAEAIKRSVSVPVVGVGRINTPKIAEDILSKKQADLVAIARQLICDPSWVKKAIENRSDEIIPCNSCNTYCWCRGSQKKPATHCCVVTKRAGEEWERFFAHS